MSSYEASSPESDVPCSSPDSCDAPPPHAPPPHTIMKKHHAIDKTKRLKASARERKRRHVLNDALESLRLKVSCFNEDSHKLSKIEILRLAIDYIAMLTYFLKATDTNPQQPSFDFYQQQQQMFMQQQGLYPNQAQVHRQQIVYPEVVNRSEFDIYMQNS